MKIKLTAVLMFALLVTGPAIAADLYGVIEIGGSGVKANVVQLVPSDEGTNTLKVRETFPTNNVNGGLPGTEKDVAAAVTQFVNRMRDEFAVNSEDLFIVASSGVAGGSHDHLERLASEVLDATRHSMDLVTSEDETRLTFEGIVPPRRRLQVLVIDIGSSNLKGTYLEHSTPPRFASFELPQYGTKAFSKQVNEARGEDAFSDIARQLAKTRLVPELRDVMDRRPGLQNIDRVYLSGGIVWATTTLVRPQAQLKDWTKIYAEDFITVNTKAVEAPSILFKADFAKLPDEVRAAASKDLDALPTIFSRDNMVAGTEILLALSRELDLKHKTIFFPRKAINAWMTGYLQEKIGKGGSDEDEP